MLSLGIDLVLQRLLRGFSNAPATLHLLCMTPPLLRGGGGGVDELHGLSFSLAFRFCGALSNQLVYRNVGVELPGGGQVFPYALSSSPKSCKSSCAAVVRPATSSSHSSMDCIRLKCSPCQGTAVYCVRAV